MEETPRGRWCASAFFSFVWLLVPDHVRSTGSPPSSPPPSDLPRRRSFSANCLFSGLGSSEPRGEIRLFGKVIWRWLQFLFVPRSFFPAVWAIWRCWQFSNVVSVDVRRSLLARTRSACSAEPPTPPCRRMCGRPMPRCMRLLLMLASGRCGQSPSRLGGRDGLLRDGQECLACDRESPACRDPGDRTADAHPPLQSPPVVGTSHCRRGGRAGEGMLLDGSGSHLRCCARRFERTCPVLGADRWPLLSRATSPVSCPISPQKEREAPERLEG
jgi:hypothetical protein